MKVPIWCVELQAQRNSDDKLELSFKQNRSKSVKQKRRDKHVETRCRGKSDASNRCTHDLNVGRGLVRCAPRIIFFFVQCPLSLLQVSVTVDNDPL